MSGGTGGSLLCSSGQCYILSENADLSTDDRVYSTSDTLNMGLFSDSVDHTDLKKAEYELKDADKNKVKSNLTNHGDGSFSAAVDLGTLPSSLTSWTWKGKVESNSGSKYQPTDTITVNP